MELDIPYRLLAMILLIALIVGAVVQTMYIIPHYPRVDEGFASIVSVDASTESFRTLPEATVFLGFLDSARRHGGMDSARRHGGSGGMSGSAVSAERRELELLLFKLSALHQDLLSTNRRVDATLRLPFETAHDRVVVGELCGMCLQQTISSRDLGIAFESWRQRGEVLLRKLCTEYDLSETDVLFAEKQWLALWTKVYDVATTRCLPSLLSPVSSVRDASPYEPEHLKDTRSYEYRYGGLSASGGNGVV